MFVIMSAEPMSDLEHKHDIYKIALISDVDNLLVSSHIRTRGRLVMFTASVLASIPM
jgi:hypothetical protein